MVKSPLSFWKVLTVVRRISSRIIWHSLMIDVKLVCIICISVDKILRLCEHELIPKWPLTKVVIFSSPSKVVREMLPHKRISVKISPLEASFYHFAPSVLSDLARAVQTLKSASWLRLGVTVSRLRWSVCGGHCSETNNCHNSRCSRYHNIARGQLKMVWRCEKDYLCKGNRLRDCSKNSPSISFSDRKSNFAPKASFNSSQLSKRLR